MSQATLIPAPKSEKWKLWFLKGLNLELGLSFYFFRWGSNTWEVHVEPHAVAKYLMELTLVNDDDIAFLRCGCCFLPDSDGAGPRKTDCNAAVLHRTHGTEAPEVISHSMKTSPSSSRPSMPGQTPEDQDPSPQPPTITTWLPSDGQVLGSGAARLRFCTYFI